MVLAGTETVSWVGRLLAVGIIGPALREPREVATKKLTLEPVVKFDPTMLKLAPAKITQGMPLMTGGIGVGVAVGLGVRVGVVVGVAVRLGVRVGVVVGVAVRLGVEVGVVVGVV
jgi:hypothetical protein